MSKHALKHLTDDTLRRDLKSAVATENAATSVVLAHVAEYDFRKLYLPDGYASMFEYCVEELGMSEDQACNRIEVARKGREFPALFEAIDDGRLTLSAIRELGPYLSPTNADDLIAESSALRIRDLRIHLAKRFPRGEALRLDGGVIPAAPRSAGRSEAATDLSATSRIDPPAQKPVKPLSPNRFALEFTISQATHDRLRYFQSLTGISNDLENAFDRALEIAVARVEKKKFGAAANPRRSDRRGHNPRYIPMDVRRVVWMRDEGRCTFTSEKGRRCTVVGRVEFDHVVPVARGGKATVENVRLLCPAHNQYEAGRILGDGFMERKRRLADVAAALRSLRAGSVEARLAAEHALAKVPEGTLEDQVRAALQWLRPRSRRSAVEKELAAV